MFNKETKPAGSSPLSDFIRNASARDKKRVYGAVLKKASDKQNAIIEKSRSVAG